jgi:predicted ATPase/DNA-binding XRE family transcriptional regulator
MPSLRSPTLVGLLKDYRAAAGLTQSELAERARLSVRAISDLERGVRRAPHKDTLLLLAEALGLDEEKRALLLGAARRSRRTGPPATTALLHAPLLPSDYPDTLTPLIGRERDEASVTHLLTQANVRLLTLTGPAGIGKTRLAMQVAANLHDRFADGIVFISLAAISDPHLVLQAVAQEFGLREQVSQPMEKQLRNFLAEHETLIVLDNFEQVARAGPDIARFVAACPGVKVLVTSRAALRIRGEHEFAVPPLDIPDPACLPVVEDLPQYAAVALFMQRARAVKPTFTLTHRDAPTVAAICVRLDGLPLALELAAARIKLLSSEAILARLDSSLTLLTYGPADLPGRQQTMRRAIAWSYDLLDEPEQRLFRRLGVFVGGWTLEAAEAICGESSRQAAEVLNGLTSLVDKSLVTQGGDTQGEPRFRLLELIREYAVERQEEAGEAEELRRRHAEYFGAGAEESATKIFGRQEIAGHAWLIREMGNLRAAMAWSRQTGEIANGLRIAGALWRTWRLIGQTSEGRALLEDLLERDEQSRERKSPPDIRAAALFGAAILANIHHNAERALTFANEGLRLYQAAGNWSGIAGLINARGVILGERGDYLQEVRLYDEALAIRRRLGDSWWIALGLNNLGDVAFRERNYDRARQLYEDSLAHFRASGAKSSVALALTQLGSVARAQGDSVQAGMLYRQGRHIRRSIARRLANDAVHIDAIWHALECLGGVALDQGLPLQAARLFGAASRLHDMVGVPRFDDVHRIHECDVERTEQALGDERFATAWGEGHAMSLEEAVALATDDYVPDDIDP